MNTIISKPAIRTQSPTDRQIASGYRSAFASRAEKLGGFILRYGLVAILLYFGAYKFTTEEARGIAQLPTVRSSTGCRPHWEARGSRT
jgi:hypothetical protein